MAKQDSDILKRSLQMPYIHRDPIHQDESEYPLEYKI